MKKGSAQPELLGFRISEKLMTRLDKLATLEHRNRSQMARLLMEQAVERKEEELGGIPQN